MALLGQGPLFRIQIYIQKGVLHILLDRSQVHELELIEAVSDVLDLSQDDF